jgi:hypothetical protein
MTLDPADHRTLAVWAAACAEHVLPRFEGPHPEDERPRDAIEAARAWSRGQLAVGEARKAAFGAHAAARNAGGPSAIAGARAAGHAAATAHVAGHAAQAATYAAKAAGAGREAEREWQRERLPEDLWDEGFKGDADATIQAVADGADPAAAAFKLSNEFTDDFVERAGAAMRRFFRR